MFLLVVGALAGSWATQRPQDNIGCWSSPSTQLGLLVFVAAYTRLAGPTLLRILMSPPPISSQECCNYRCSLIGLACHGFCGFKMKVLTFGQQDLDSLSHLSSPVNVTNKHFNTFFLRTENPGHRGQKSFTPVHCLRLSSSR